MSANSDSATKSRSDTASRLFSNRAAKPRSSATPSGSSGIDEPASAPAPSGDTSARARGVEEPVDVAGQRPPVGEEVVGERRPAGRAAGACSRAGRRRRPRPPGRGAPAAAPRPAGRPRAARASCRAGGRWRPGRCGCGRCGAWRRPGASSVARRSTAVWMSSSDGSERERAVGQLLPRPGRGRASTSSRSASVRIPMRARPRTWARDPAMSSGASRWSNGQAHREGEQLVGRPALEAAVPERGDFSAISPSRGVLGCRPRSRRTGPRGGRSRRSPRGGSCRRRRRWPGRSRRGCAGSAGR